MADHADLVPVLLEWADLLADEHILLVADNNEGGPTITIITQLEEDERRVIQWLL